MKRNNLIKAFLTFIIILCGNLLHTESPKQIAEVFYKNGLKYYIVGDYKNAIKHLNKGLELQKDNKKIKKILGKAHFKHALVLYQNKKYEQSKENFEFAKNYNSDIEDDADQWIKRIEIILKKQHILEQKKQRLAELERKKKEHQRKMQEYINNKKRNRQALINNEKQRKNKFLSIEQKKLAEQRRKLLLAEKKRLETQTRLEKLKQERIKLENEKRKKELAAKEREQKEILSSIKRIEEAKERERLRKYKLEHEKLKLQHQAEMARLKMRSNSNEVLADLYKKRMKSMKEYERNLKRQYELSITRDKEIMQLARGIAKSDNKARQNSDKFYASFLKLLKDDLKNPQIKALLKEQQLKSDNYLKKIIKRNEEIENKFKLYYIIIIAVFVIGIILILYLVFRKKGANLEKKFPLALPPYYGGLNEYSDIMKNGYKIPEKVLDIQGEDEDNLFYNKIPELDTEQKKNLLKTIETKIKNLLQEDVSYILSNIFEPLLIDGDREIREKAQNMFSKFSTLQDLPKDEAAKKDFALSWPSLISMANLIDLKTHRYDNNIRVANMAKEIAKLMELSQNQTENIFKAGLIRDIGFLGVEPAIFLKKEKLTSGEKQLIKQHPAKSNDYINFMELDITIQNVLCCHHENLKGSGYPKGIKNVPIEAQIVHIAETFEALTGHRPYNKTMNNISAFGKINGEMCGFVENQVLEALELVVFDDDKIKNISVFKEI